MRTRRSLIAFATVAVWSATVLAAITPSWKVNSITPEAVALEPRLAGAVSVSLWVELDGGSQFYAAGVDLTPLVPGAEYYNAPNWNLNFPPHLWEPLPSPPTLFDTYIAGGSSHQNVSVAGRLNGNGQAVIGTGGFNVAWGVPASGGTEPIEIARITFLGSNGFAIAPPGQGIPIPISSGLVLDDLNPNQSVALPPLPIVVPEPTAALSVLALTLFRRWR